jgi:hypothetical protein
MPQVGLTGRYMPTHGSFEQVPPEGTQIPQLGLQQISATLQVLGPHGMLTGWAGAPQKSEHVSPGRTQVLQFQLQHCCPSGQVRHPQRTGCVAWLDFAADLAGGASSCAAPTEASMLPAAASTWFGAAPSETDTSETAASSDMPRSRRLESELDRATSLPSGLGAADSRASPPEVVPVTPVSAASIGDGVRSKGAASSIPESRMACAGSAAGRNKRSMAESVTLTSRTRVSTAAAMPATIDTTPQVLMEHPFRPHQSKTWAALSGTTVLILSRTNRLHRVNEQSRPWASLLTKGAPPIATSRKDSYLTMMGGGMGV